MSNENNRKKHGRAALVLSMLGPGVIAMLANNDAGGMLEYALTGAKFGISFFIPLLFLFAPVSYLFQELSMRLSAVTGAEYRELALRRFGKGASAFSVTALTLANTLYIVTEFVGMTAGLTLLGLPLWLADIICLVFLASVTLLMGYARKEKLALAVGCVNVAFIVVAVLTKPDLGRFAASLVHVPAMGQDFGSDSMPIFIMATLGNTVAPFMLFFQSGATLDKELTSGDIRHGRLDILIGSILQPLFAAVVMVCGAALAGSAALPDDAAGMITAIASKTGTLGGVLFALGLFNAGWMAATTISTSTAYAVSGAFGRKRGQNFKISEAPYFYGVYFAGLTIGAAAVLIPGLPLAMLAVFTQIIGAALLVPDMVFLVILTSDAALMGKFANRKSQKIFGWLLVMIFTIMSILSIITACL